MITYKNYIRYKTLNSREKVEEWFQNKAGIYSNREDYQDAVNHLNDYKDAHKRNYGKNPDKKVYRNIYAHSMLMLIPFEFHSVENAMNFVKEYMIQLDGCYKKANYLYCYRLIKRGKGLYADIVAFTRKIYQTPYEKPEKYNRDYYWNPITKRISTEKDINAVLRHKKGEIKLDKDGQPVMTKCYIAPVEKEIFKYGGFDINSLTSYLRSIVSDVRLTLLRKINIWIDNYKKYISLLPRKTKDHYGIARNVYKNKLINHINKELSSLYDSLIQGYLIDGSEWYDKKGKWHSGWFYNLKSFHWLVFRIDQIIKKSNITWKDDRGKSHYIYTGSKQTFADYKHELKKLNEYILYLINKWWRVHICDLQVDNDGNTYLME